MEFNEIQTHDHACDHHPNGTKKSCIALVPIFNHLEEEQMEEIMKTAQSVHIKKEKPFTKQATNQILFI